MTAARERTDAEQLVLGLTAIWQDGYARARLMQLADDPSWRTTAAQVVDQFGVIYLLMVLREADPAAADRAARFLSVDSARTPLAQLVDEIQTAVITGGPMPEPRPPH